MPTSRSWLSCVSLQLRKEILISSCPGTPSNNWSYKERKVFVVICTFLSNDVLLSSELGHWAAKGLLRAVWAVAEIQKSSAVVCDAPWNKLWSLEFLVWKQWLRSRYRLKFLWLSAVWTLPLYDVNMFRWNVQTAQAEDVFGQHVVFLHLLCVGLMTSCRNSLIWWNETCYKSSVGQKVLLWIF